jgi:hypothetical protein
MGKQPRYVLVWLTPDGVAEVEEIRGTVQLKIAKEAVNLNETLLVYDGVLGSSLKFLEEVEAA